MSRIGKHPVQLPAGVEVAIDGQAVRVKGKLGELAATLPAEVKVQREDGAIRVEPRSAETRARAMWKPSCKPVRVSLVLRLLCNQTVTVVGLKFVMAAWVSP